jgi:hypothetical protein
VRGGGTAEGNERGHEHSAHGGSKTPAQPGRNVRFGFAWSGNRTVVRVRHSDGVSVKGGNDGRRN